MVILSRLVGEVSNEGEHGGDDGVEDCGEGDDDDKVVDESSEDEEERDSEGREEDEIEGGGDSEVWGSGSGSDISCNFLLFIPRSSFTNLSSPNM